MSEKPKSSMSDLSAGVRQLLREGDSNAIPPATALRRASQLVETTAFDEASALPAAVISQLILLAAELERLAQVVEQDV